MNNTSHSRYTTPVLLPPLQRVTAASHPLWKQNFKEQVRWPSGIFSNRVPDPLLSKELKITTRNKRQFRVCRTLGGKKKNPLLINRPCFGDTAEAASLKLRWDGARAQQRLLCNVSLLQMSANLNSICHLARRFITFPRPSQVALW